MGLLYRYRSLIVPEETPPIPQEPKPAFDSNMSSREKALFPYSTEMPQDSGIWKNALGFAQNLWSKVRIPITNVACKPVIRNEPVQRSRVDPVSPRTRQRHNLIIRASNILLAKIKSEPGPKTERQDTFSRAITSIASTSACIALRAARAKIEGSYANHQNLFDLAVRARLKKRKGTRVGRKIVRRKRRFKKTKRKRKRKRVRFKGKTAKSRAYAHVEKNARRRGKGKKLSKKRRRR